MTESELKIPASNQHIRVMVDGPYVVQGDIPLVSKTQIVSEHGEPLTWKKIGEIPAGKGEYLLCRCGRSTEKPFCSGAHCEFDFDGSESADTNMTEERSHTYSRATRIIVKKDASLCMNSGFCGFLNAGIFQLVASTQDTKTRSLVIAMVERCPSGALTYRFDPGEPAIEPDLPVQVAMTTEITAGGPIEGPLWVTGNIPIERSDGQPFETRNRVTLCNCGHSSNKPLCDGTHRAMAEQEHG